MKTLLLFFALLVALTVNAADDFVGAVQKGLFEEEANHNLEAAIQAYQMVLATHDEQRKLAATALFRLGECYRKLGRTNDAVAQYQRLLRDFSDQGALARLSEQNLTALGTSRGPGEVLPPVAATEDEEKEVRRIQALIKDSPDLINSQGSQGGTPLHTAALNGQLAVARFLLANGADVNSQETRDRSTPLHLAARAGGKSMVELLLANGARVDVQKPDGNTPLFVAAFRGYRSVVEVLLANQANPNIPGDGTTRSPRSPLHAVAGANNSEIAALLLANGAEVDARDKGGATPLHDAASAGATNAAVLLLEHRAEVNARDRDERTPLHYAALNGHTAAAALLLAAKADPNAEDQARFRPLHLAAQKESGALVDALIAGGAEPNARDGERQTALDIAVSKDSATAVAALLRGKADPNIVVAGSWTPLYSAVARKRKDLVELLLENGANPNVQIEKDPGYSAGVTPLSRAAINNQGPIVALLLEHKADPNMHDDRGNAPLRWAVGIGDAAMVEDLLKHGADQETRSAEGETPLTLAIGRGDPQIVGLLLKNGANPNARTRNGQTPLHKAAYYDKKELLELLLANQADPNATDNEGRTALDYIKQDLRYRDAGVPQPLLRPTASLAPGFARPEPALSPRQSELIAVLRKSGATEWAPRPGQLTLTRRSNGSVSAVFRQGTNDNQFTLFDLIAAAEVDGRAGRWPFPDFSHVTISRLNDNTGQMEQIPVNVAEAIAAGDCSRNVPLRWGDLVDIPEREHGLNEISLGLPADFAQALAGCLSRTVQVTVKRQTRELPLKVKTFQVAGSAVGVAGAWSISHPEFWLAPVLRNSGFLLTSSDLQHVRVKRTDPATGKPKEWVFDLDRLEAPNDLWLRDGDQIEVPEK